MIHNTRHRSERLLLQFVFVGIALIMLFFRGVAQPVYADSRVIETPTESIAISSNAYYAINEIPRVSIKQNRSITQNLRRILYTVTGQRIQHTLTITDPTGTVKTEDLNGTTQTVSMDERSLHPGTYTVSIDTQLTTRFSWGILVINTDKDHYNSGETAYLQIAALNSGGHTICNAKLSLTITLPNGQTAEFNTQNGSIVSSSTCGHDNVTDSPDYYIQYPVTETGTYQLALTNTDIGATVHTTFSAASMPFQIKRTSATRINPFKSEYTMHIKLTTSRDFNGTVTETVPDTFEIMESGEGRTQKLGNTQTITWQTQLRSGAERNFSYTYKAPPISPAIFDMGPAQLTERGQETYAENRSWNIASDATFSMQTGYYVGDGTDNRAITGVGFQPQFILIKGDAAGTVGIVWKSSAMSGETSALLGTATADIATDAIQSLDSNGFTLGTNANVNGANTRFTWVAFRGSDCTASGTFCVGSYTGDGTATHALSNTGFQPDMVTVKGSGATEGLWRSSSMAANITQYFDGNDQVTDGSRFKTLDSTGFTVGANAEVNTNGTNYWFFAFKSTANAFAVGTYTGDGTDNRAITGVGFQPQYVWDKKAIGTAPERLEFNLTESYGDYSSAANANANTVNSIQSLDSDGFTVGSDGLVNESTKTFYWVAFAGAANPTIASGTYRMSVGTYTGNGTSKSITGLGFAPDLIIVRDQSGGNYAVFRTKLMKADTTSYFVGAGANFTGGITSMDSDGFSVGSNATVNTNATTYTYQAFGNAFNAEKNTGAADFAIGAYTGNRSIDNRNIVRVPFQPNFVTVKPTNGNSGVLRTSSQTGDLSVGFDNLEAANLIQALNSDGFQIGSDGTVDPDDTLVNWFAFKASTTMVVNSYTGTGAAQNITTPGFSPNLVWVKNSAATSMVFRPSTTVGDSTLFANNNAAGSGMINSMLSNGFSLGSGDSRVNTSGTTYRYAAWKINTAPATPSLDLPTNAATGQSLSTVLKTTTTDPDSNYMQYKIQLCTDSGMTTGCQTFDETSSQTGWSGQDANSSLAYASGTQAVYTIQSPLSAGTTYYWQSYAIDPNGANTWSGTQTPHSFTTNVVPTTPTLNSPVNGATDQSVTPAMQTTTTDSDGDYLRYKIQLCTDSGMTTGCQTFTQPATYPQTGWTGQDAATDGSHFTAYASGTQATYTVQSALSAATTYYWRSYAIDPGGTNTFSPTQATPRSFSTAGTGSTVNMNGLNMQGVNIN